MKRRHWSQFVSITLAGALCGCGSADTREGRADPTEEGDAAASGELEPELMEPAPGSQLLSFTCRDDATQRSSEPASDAALPNLRDLGRTIGVALSAQRLAEVPYGDTAAAHFNQVTPENEMKWDSVEPSPGQFNFGPADAIVSFARDRDMKVRGHTLVWHSQLPAWVDALTGADAVRAAMTLHIQTVVGHFRDTFPGVVVGWDVVNEALTGFGGGMAGYRDSVFYRELGEGFIAEAFQIAREADPDALLFYNDFSIEGMGGKSNATFDMVSALVAAGVPIDGIGFQMHTGPEDRGPGLAEFEANIARYAELGLLIEISEMDVNLCALGNNVFALEAQRYRYNRMLGACLASPACNSISVWGLADPHSWLNMNGCNDAAWLPMPLAFDAEYARKPAWWGIYDALAGCRYE